MKIGLMKILGYEKSQRSICASCTCETQALPIAMLTCRYFYADARHENLSEIQQVNDESPKKL